MISRYEQNIALQPKLIREILVAPRPSWLDQLKNRRISFVGVGTNYHAAQIMQCLWRRHVSPDAEAVGSLDFIRLPQPTGSGDAVVVLSHRGASPLTSAVAHHARAHGAAT